MTKQVVKPKYRINTFWTAVIIGFTCVCWGLQVICSLTGVGEIVSEMIGWSMDFVLFIFFFITTRNNFYTSNSLTKFSIMFGCSLIEIIPFINDVPASIVEAVSLILIARREDEEKAKLEAAAMEKSMREHAAYMAAMLAAQKRRNDKVDEFFS